VVEVDLQDLAERLLPRQKDDGHLHNTEHNVMLLAREQPLDHWRKLAASKSGVHLFGNRRVPPARTPTHLRGQRLSQSPPVVPHPLEHVVGWAQLSEQI